jgi:hypothetical protein
VPALWNVRKIGNGRVCGVGNGARSINDAG